MRPNRPHIPSDIMFSKSVDTKRAEPPISWRVLQPCIQSSSAAAFALAFRRRRLHRCASSSSVRRYLRSLAPHRKRKKRASLHFSVTPHVYRGFAAPEARTEGWWIAQGVTPGAPKRQIRRPVTPDSPFQAANPWPWWVIRPPDTVSAIPVWPICSAGIVSMSPSMITRSAAIPTASRPVRPSRCPAQAPPAV